MFWDKEDKQDKPSKKLTLKRKWREMTRTSKQLLLGSILFVFILMYFLLIFIPTGDKIEGLKGQIENNKLSISSSQELIDKINEMKADLGNPNFTRNPIGNYSNLDNETVLISDIISSVNGKNSVIDTSIPIMTMSNKTKFIARTIMVSFTVGKYDDAVKAVEQFSNMRLKSLVKEFSISGMNTIKDVSDDVYDSLEVDNIYDSLETNEYYDNIQEETKTNQNVEVYVELVFFEHKPNN